MTFPASTCTTFSLIFCVAVTVKIINRINNYHANTLYTDVEHPPLPPAVTSDVKMEHEIIGPNPSFALLQFKHYQLGYSKLQVYQRIRYVLKKNQCNLAKFEQHEVVSNFENQLLSTFQSQYKHEKMFKNLTTQLNHSFTDSSNRFNTVVQYIKTAADLWKHIHSDIFISKFSRFT